MMESLRSRQSPFRSLDFFTSADASVFSGREEEIEEVATRIVAGPTLVLYGPSGVGKTSLLCAGVVPALENRRGYRVTYVRPLLSPRGDVWKAVGADPEEPLADALVRLPALPSPDATPPEGTPLASSLTLSDPAIVVLHDQAPFLRPTASAPHVLILDQLEELFTRFDESQRRPLWDGLVEVLENPSAPVRLVLSLREEYLYLLDSAHPRLPNLLDRRFRLRGLAPFGARTAIVRPLVAARIRYEPELVDRCVADLTDTPAGHMEEDGVVDPLLLQIVSSEVYREAEQRNPEAPAMTLIGYAELGGPAGVFRRHLDELFHRVSVGDHLLLKLVLQEMTTAHATKAPTTVSRLSQAGLLAPAAELQGLLDKLVAASLVRRYDADPEPWYELVHDRLVHALPQHFSTDQQFLRLRYMRELVSQLSKGLVDGMGGAPLLNRQQLADLVEPFHRYIRFGVQELNLLFRSAIANEHNVAMWCDALEAVAPGKWRAVILEMLSYPETRRGAIASIGQLRSTHPEHLAHCIELALYDNDVSLVRVATQALSEVANAAEILRVGAALSERRLRTRAQWILAELSDNPSTRVLPPRVLRSARRERNRRRLMDAWDDIQRGGWNGLRLGVRAGAGASLVTIVFWFVALIWLGHDELAQSVEGAAAIAAASLTLGVTSGCFMGRAMIRLQKLGRSVTWLLGVQHQDVLSAHAVALVTGATLIGFLVLDQSHVLISNIPETESHPALLAVALGALAPVVVVAALALTEWMLPPHRWHRTRGPVVVTARALSLSWLLVICVGVLLMSLTTGPGPKPGAIIVGTALFGGWCGVCTTSIAAVFAESIWRRSMARPIRLRRWLHWFPISALPVVTILLLWSIPLPRWAPLVDLPSTNGDQFVRSGDIGTRESFGRWYRIRNTSSDPRVVSLTPANRATQLDSLLLVWPGTHAQWFPESIIQYNFPRRIDLDREPPDRCTYAVIRVNNPRVTEGALKRDMPANLFLRELACKVAFSDAQNEYYDGSGRSMDDTISAARVGPWHSIRDLSISNLGCLHHFLKSRLQDVTHLDIVVLFEYLEGQCWK